MAWFKKKKKSTRKERECHAMLQYYSYLIVPPCCLLTTYCLGGFGLIVRQEISSLNGYLLVAKLFLCHNTGFWLQMPVFKARAVYCRLVEHILLREVLFFLASDLSTSIPYSSVIGSWYNRPG